MGRAELAHGALAARPRLAEPAVLPQHRLLVGHTRDAQRVRGCGALALCALAAGCAGERPGPAGPHGAGPAPDRAAARAAAQGAGSSGVAPAARGLWFPPGYEWKELFGLVERDGRWVAGFHGGRPGAASPEISLRPLGASGLGEPIAALRASGGETWAPASFVVVAASAPASAIIVERARAPVGPYLWSLDGGEPRPFVAGEPVRLEWSRRTPAAFRPGPAPRGLVVRQIDIPAEIGRTRGASPGGEQVVADVIGGDDVHRVVVGTHTGRHAPEWRALQNLEAHLVGEHAVVTYWLVEPGVEASTARVTLVASWLDARGEPVRAARGEAPAGATPGHAVILEDGTVVAVTGAGYARDHASAAHLLVLGADGTPRAPRELPLDGWLPSDSFALLACGRRAWAVVVDFASAVARETIWVQELVLEGALAGRRALWTFDAPRELPPGARLGHAVFPACGVRAAGALVTYPDSRRRHDLVLLEWPLR